jgi:PhzF family phenazine biosynthesis protein
MKRRFVQLDVFGEGPYQGNPLAVVVDGEGLDAAQMQRFARWTNLSETTFLLPPDDGIADYRVRIFTPAGELPFAGHPTLGSAHAWRACGGVPRREGVLLQACGVGHVPLRLVDGRWAFAAPPLLRGGPADEPTIAVAAAALDLPRDAIVDAAWADNGPGWLALLLRSADAVLGLRPGAVPLSLGVAGPYPEGSPFAFEVRAFSPEGGQTVEDPVTGSLNASLAQWLLATGRATAPYVASQGTALGRAGRVYITADERGAVWVGGDVATCVTGTVEL